MFKAFLIFGESPEPDQHIQEVSYNTQEELTAYLQGVQDMSGWFDHIAFSDQQAAENYLAKVAAEKTQIPSGD